MLKLCTIAAIVACANGYYNHGPVANPSYYGSAVGHPLPVNGHHGSIYNSGYGNYGSGSSSPKIIEATYPGAVHKTGNYAVTNPAGYVGAEYPHGAINHAALPASGFVHGPSTIAGHPQIAYNHGAVGVQVHAPISYNHGQAAAYGHSGYAVTEGPGTYSAHSRYAISGAPALALSQHPHRYQFAASPGAAYAHPVPVDHRIQKIAYDHAVSQMGYHRHAAQSYSW